jgi:YHS domain-containing protein
VFRAILELIITILVAMVARAVIGSVVKGFGNAAAASRQAPPRPQQQQQQTAAKPTGELHKDPVCGTYVAESTAFQRRASGQTFYYCSDACRSKHALAS